MGFMIHSTRLIYVPNEPHLSIAKVYIVFELLQILPWQIIIALQKLVRVKARLIKL